MPFEGDNMMGVKRNNRSAALRILHERGSMSRKRLSESIKLTPAAITKIVGEMIAEGLLTEGSMLPGSVVGRREVMVELNFRARAALGVFINLREAVISAAGARPITGVPSPNGAMDVRNDVITSMP